MRRITFHVEHENPCHHDECHRFHSYCGDGNDACVYDDVFVRFFLQRKLVSPTTAADAVATLWNLTKPICNPVL